MSPEKSATKSGNASGNKKDRSWYYDKKSRGICVREYCQNKCSETSVLCDFHHKKQTQYEERYRVTPRSRRYHVKYGRRRRRKYTKEARCKRCGSDNLKTHTLCWKCSEDGILYSRTHRKRPKAKNPQRCSVCKEFGHNRIRHRDPEKVTAEGYATARNNVTLYD